MRSRIWTSLLKTFIMKKIFILFFLFFSSLVFADDNLTGNIFTIPEKEELWSTHKLTKRFVDEVINGVFKDPANKDKDLRSYRLDFSKMKTHEFSLTNAEKAIKTLYESEDDEAICVHLNPNIKK